jgi:transposase-like protein
MRMRGAEAEAKWSGLIKEQEQSGQSVASFCRERGVRASQFYAWKQRIRLRAGSGFVEVRSGAEPASAGRRRNGAIEVRLHGGRGLLVEPGFDPDHLQALLTVLERSL